MIFKNQITKNTRRFSASVSLTLKLFGHRDVRAVFIEIFFSRFYITIFAVEAFCADLCAQVSDSRTLCKFADFVLAGTKDLVAQMFAAIIFQYADAADLPYTVFSFVDAGSTDWFFAVINGQMPAYLIQIIEFYFKTLFDYKNICANKKCVVTAFFPCVQTNSYSCFLAKMIPPHNWDSSIISDYSGQINFKSRRKIHPGIPKAELMIRLGAVTASPRKGKKLCIRTRHPAPLTAEKMIPRKK